MNHAARKSLWTAACIACASGIIMTSFAPFAWRSHHRLLTRKQNDLHQIFLMQQRAETYSAAVKAYEALPSPVPLSVAQLLVPMPSGGGHEITDGAPQPLTGGWRIETKYVKLRSIPGPDCLAIINRFGSAVPPWVTTAIDITAGNATGVLSEVAMTMDALARESRGN